MKRLLLVACLFVALFDSTAPRASANDGVMVPGYVPPPPPPPFAEMIVVQVIVPALSMQLP
jgi:hypothetical protein